MQRDVVKRISLALAPATVALAACSPLATPKVVDRQGQPTSVDGGATQGAASSSGKPARVVANDRRWKAGERQYGLQVYAHNAKSTPADAHIDRVLDYVVGLGANSVAFSFPLYTDGQHPTKVSSGAETPSPQVMTRLVTKARERGLRVMIRPLIDEANLTTSAGGWRGTIQPPSLDRWFSSYEAAIRPYLRVAREAGAQEFVIAAELTSLQKQSARWRALANRAAKLFPGTLSYTFNYDSEDVSMVPPSGSAGLDLYFSVDAGPDASVATLASALAQQIKAKPRAMRADMVAQEVGIAAEDGAYQAPWRWGTKKGKVNPAIQVNWFTASCQAVQQTGLKGIYFWMVDSSVDPTQVDPSTEGTAGFIGRPGEKAIERCFAGAR